MKAAGILSAALLVAAAGACVGVVKDPPGGADGSDREDTGAGTPEAEAALSTPILRRLTKQELANTLEDLLGRELLGTVSAVPGESPEVPYDRMGAAQSVSPLHVEAYLGISEAGRLPAR